MATGATSQSVGVTETRILKLDLPPEGFRLESGQVLPEIDVAYETYGALNKSGDNAFFICHALTGDAHAAGYHGEVGHAPGWWDEMIGPGKGIDTDQYYVICANILGGCRGTTGPSSIDPAAGRVYGSRFPDITVRDIVRVHRLLLRELGIERLAGIVGGSFGGMQVLEWAAGWPESIERAICIASATSLSAQALAFDMVGRKAIVSDPDWAGGDYYASEAGPHRGLAHARKIGHITYLSRGMMAEKFGREKLPHGKAFQVESYLEHQGAKFVERFDANSYVRITDAMDQYDLGESFGSLEEAFNRVHAKVLVVSLSEDWLFPAEQSLSIARGMLRRNKDVSCCELYAPHGHDAFLVDIEHLSAVIRAFMPATQGEPPYVPLQRGARDRQAEYELIAAMVRSESRVVDLGCGDGSLLSFLATEKHITGMGVDIDIGHVIEVMNRGHDMFQSDIDKGLSMIPDDSYDYAILSETLQVMKHPRFVLHEMLRVAREGIVSFPNFGKWSHACRLLIEGRMPKGDALPYEWYDTPNIHLFTLRDFSDLCRQDGIEILDTVCTTDGRLSRALLALGLRNAAAGRVFVRIRRSHTASEGQARRNDDG
jgi:homoserine O-acetyltransferase